MKKTGYGLAVLLCLALVWAFARIGGAPVRGMDAAATLPSAAIPRSEGWRYLPILR